MDSLDDFTVLNIIVYCDMKTVFGVLPLTCRRMYELYDDVTIVQQFRGELRARIKALARNSGHVWRQESRQTMMPDQHPPLKLVAKADLDDFWLKIEISADIALQGLLHVSDIVGDIVALPSSCNMFRSVIYYAPCRLTATFEAVCSSIDGIFSGMPAHVQIGYVMRSNTAPRAVCYRETDGNRIMYSLGFGYKYTILMVTARVPKYPRHVQPARCD